MTNSLTNLVVILNLVYVLSDVKSQIDRHIVT